jgi:hypothetical protein
MSNQINKLKVVLESKNADTARLKAELIALGIPRTTLWKYINNPETDIKGTHIGIIMRVTGCTYEELIVANANTVKGNFELSKTN